MSGAMGARPILDADPADDWATRVDTWAGTAQSAPMSTTREENPHMTPRDTGPAGEQSGRRRTPTDHAVEAGERLMDAGSKVGNAYADAYQEAVVNMADFRDKFTDAGPIDWRKLVGNAGAAGTLPLNMPLGDPAKTATRVNDQFVTATKKLGLAYVDACEQVMLSVLELSEQAAMASDSEWLPAGSMGTGVARDVTRAYVDAARRLLA